MVRRYRPAEEMRLINALEGERRHCWLPERCVGTQGRHAEHTLAGTGSKSADRLLAIPPMLDPKTLPANGLESKQRPEAHQRRRSLSNRQPMQATGSLRPSLSPSHLVVCVDRRATSSGRLQAWRPCSVSDEHFTLRPWGEPPDVRDRHLAPRCRESRHGG